MKRAAAALAMTALAAALTCAPAAAWAQADRDARARAHYEVGLGMYHLGNYEDAAREFSAGYELSPRPEFLINLGQAYRKLHQLDRAAEMYQKYLATAPAEAHDRVEVRRLLDEVEAARAHEPPPSMPPPPSTTPTASTSPARSAPPAPNVVVASAPPPKSKLRRWWWTIPVGAVVVGAAVGLTLYFTLRSSQVSCGSATIACVDLRP